MSPYQDNATLIADDEPVSAPRGYRALWIGRAIGVVGLIVMAAVDDMELSSMTAIFTIAAPAVFVMGALVGPALRDHLAIRRARRAAGWR